MSKQINKILIANRGEIACRIIDTAQKLGIQTVAVYSEADADAEHVYYADESYLIGPAPATESYLRSDIIIEVAKKAGADAIHPGYGFLSENANFAEDCAKAGVVFIGPSAKAIRQMGLKDQAKIIMEDADVPVVPGYHGESQEQETLLSAAKDIGFPVLIKAVAGGGGKGMRLVENESDFADALTSAVREATSSFGDGRVLIEKYITRPRHIEVQVFGDNDGNVVHLFERDCSIQRRHQKIIEEAPAPDMSAGLRQKMCDAAVKAAKAINYTGAGTIEFIVDAAKALNDDTSFYFMEMNTRLQVEHPVTEMITGQDLVAWQITVAEGKPLPLAQNNLKITGHAIEVRLYAEDPANDFLPQSGDVLFFQEYESDGVRYDFGVDSNSNVPIYYDPMIGKISFLGKNRSEAIAGLIETLKATFIAGVKTNQLFLLNSLNNPEFKKGLLHTGFVGENIASLIKLPDETVKNTEALVAIHYGLRQILKSQWHGGDQTYSTLKMTKGWRLNLPPVMRTLVFEIAGITHQIKATYPQRYEAEDGGFEYRITIEYSDGRVQTIDKISDFYPMESEFKDNRMYLMYGGATQAVDFYDIHHLSAKDSENTGLSNLTSPMPGKIIESFVKNGDAVEEGQALLILEAMKMEYTLKAPRAGVVQGLSAKVNDQVADGEILLNIEEDTNS